MGLELTEQTRPAGEPQGSVCLCPPSIGDHKHMTPHLAFKQTKPPPQCQLSFILTEGPT